MLPYRHQWFELLWISHEELWRLEDSFKDPPKKNYQSIILYLVLPSINIAAGSHPSDPVEGGQRRRNRCETNALRRETPVTCIHFYPLHIYFHALTREFWQKSLKSTDRVGKQSNVWEMNAHSLYLSSQKSHFQLAVNNTNFIHAGFGSPRSLSSLP